MSVNAVDNVNLDVDVAEFMVITGRSGSGKTTLLSLMGGLTRPTSGRVLFEGLDIWKLDDERLSHLRRLKIGFIFQFASLIPTLSVRDNLKLPTIFYNAKFDTDKRSEHILEMVGLTSKINSYPSQLSGGEQRRVALARSLMNNPKVLLADEPTGDLDEKTEADIMEDLFHLNKKGVTIIMVTHNTELIKYSTRNITMSNGKILFS